MPKQPFSTEELALLDAIHDEPRDDGPRREQARLLDRLDELGLCYTPRRGCTTARRGTSQAARLHQLRLLTPRPRLLFSRCGRRNPRRMNDRRLRNRKTGPPTFPWPTTGPTSLRGFLSGIARDGVGGAAPDGRNGCTANVVRPDQRIAGMVGGRERRKVRLSENDQLRRDRRKSRYRLSSLSSSELMGPRRESTTTGWPTGLSDMGAG